MSPRYALIGLGSILLLLASLAGVDSCRRKVVSAAEHQSAVYEGQADAHATQAQSIPDHAKELEAAQASVDSARREVERLRRLLASKPSIPVPDPAGASAPIVPAVSPDGRDEVIAAQVVLIAAQDGQIKGLKLALGDESRRSSEWKAAFEAERKRAAGLEIALDAQKHIAASGRWRGRLEGLAVGLGAGLIAGRLR